MSESADAGTLAHEPLKLGEVTLLFLPLFTVALGYGAVLPLLPSLLTRLHAGGVHSGLPLHAGFLTALYIGAFVIGAPLWGRATDRRGPRLVLVVGLLGYAAANLGQAAGSAGAGLLFSAFPRASFTVVAVVMFVAAAVARMRRQRLTASWAFQ